VVSATDPHGRNLGFLDPKPLLSQIICSRTRHDMDIFFFFSYMELVPKVCPHLVYVPPQYID
jgi:hypothetical protein